MQLDIPDDIMQSSGLTEAECLIELAIHLYAERRISLRQALRLSGLDRLTFEQHLARRDIALYTLDDLRDDVDTLKAHDHWSHNPLIRQTNTACPKELQQNQLSP